MLFTLVIIGVLTAVAVPEVLSAVRGSRARAASRYLAARMVRSRTLAVMRSANVALRFQSDAQGVTVAEFIDGNWNGVRSADIAIGIDTPLDALFRLSDRFPTVAIAFSQDGVSLDPIQIGSTTFLSFTPQGTSTSGSIYVRGAEGSQFALRVLGATGRIRVLRYLERAHAWVDAL